LAATAQGHPANQNASNASKGTSRQKTKDDVKRQEWLERARWLLLQPRGKRRMLRSIAERRKRYGYKASLRNQAKKAEQYLHRYQRYMNYAEQKSRGYPIGSGVVESAQANRQ
jgi:hypothetical protein